MAVEPYIVNLSNAENKCRSVLAGLGSTMGTATAGAVDSTATGFGGSENTQANTDAAERGDKSE